MKKHLQFMALAIAWTSVSHAETAIRWSQFPGGGGATGSATVLINGSIGGFAAGTSSVNTTVNASGFWTGVPMSVFSALPFLSVQLSDGSKLLLSWPVTAEGFSLERATVLSPADWADIRTDPDVIEGQNVVSQEPVGNGFYRLKKE